MKTSLSSFDIFALSSELQTQLGGYIGKIYHPQKNLIVIRIKTQEGEKDFTVSPGNWMALTPKQPTSHQAPSTFAMTLRKYLSRGKIEAVHQLDFERILIMDIVRDSLYHIIFELFSTGNIILTDKDNTIIFPLRRQEWAQRTIKPGEMYQPPPARTNPFTLDSSSFIKILQESKDDLIHALIVNLNLGGQIGEEICIRAHLPKATLVTELDQKDCSMLYSIFQDIQKLYTDKTYQPVIVKKDHEVIDVSPISLHQHKGYTLEKKETYNQAISEFFHQVSPPEEKETPSALHRIKEQQEKAIQQLQEEITLFHEEGDFIYAHYGEIKKILDDIPQDIRKKRWGKTIEISVPLPQGIVKTIRLNPSKTLNANAALKYEKSKKAREKLLGARQALKSTQKQLAAAPKPSEEPALQTSYDTGKTFWFENYRWFISSDGNVVVGGKDAKSNEKLVKKHLEKGDRYIHATIKGASSVIVKTHDVNGDSLPISEKTLREACQFAVAFSKAWNQFGEMDAYWVKPEQVSKSPPAGEFLPRGSFMITGERHFHRCTMEYAVTLVTLGAITKLMGAPIKVAKTHKKWVVVTPGKDTKDTIAHKIASFLEAPVDAILSALPPGDMTITEMSK